MVRAGRTTQRATEEPSEASPPPTKKTSKKRKRGDVADTKDTTIKDKKRKVKSEHEGSVDSDAAPENDATVEPETIDEDLAEEPGPSLASYDAERVLQVLESSVYLSPATWFFRSPLTTP